MKYRVVCAEYKTTPVQTREQAERRRELIIDTGACRHEHHIVEVCETRADYRSRR